MAEAPPGTRMGEAPEAFSGFKGLHLKERAGLRQSGRREIVPASKGLRIDSALPEEDAPRREIWVKEVSEDYVGLALSGGGIRSATFNLGVLQSLAGLGVLKWIDFLSTVSGGGYIGGWFSRHFAASGDFHSLKPNLGQPESKKVRHLREFSRFLSPRWGLLETETGSFIVSVIAGLIPSLLASCSFLVLGMWLWWDVLWLLDGRTQLEWAAAHLLFPLTFLIACEVRWRSSVKAASADQRGLAYRMWTLLAASLSVAFGRGAAVWLRPVAALPGIGSPSLEGWDSLLGFSGAWLASAGVLGFLRFIAFGSSRDQVERAERNALDRVLARLLLLSAGWTLFSGLWMAGLLLADQSFTIQWSPALVTGVLVAVFSWLTTPKNRDPAPGRSESRKSWWRPWIIPILAYLALAAGLVLASRAVLRAGEWWRSGDGGWTMALLWLPVPPLAVLAVVVCFFRPSSVGLHDAYRARIARAYLGNPEPFVDEMKADDPSLAELPRRPVHLVCCAANDLAGDPLPNLGRGARSATLSRNGLHVRDDWRRWGVREVPTLGSALTASAAAFNPNMGAVSLRLGPGVTFLMAALNLRLGLWVRRARQQWWEPFFPGWLFVNEMFQRTSTRDGSSHVHLSDGGHFENLGLYELVRRHCRCIIVSDCGADPDYRFEDVGNAIRLIREDFGVEVKIDLQSLKPNPEGFVRQHCAVGRIHYSVTDVGTLILLKPVRTRELPNDLLQYWRENPRFPQESTEDQFYDHAQWESYRRLGEKSTEEAFGFLLRKGGPRTEDVRGVFEKAYYEWYPTPPELTGQFLDLTKRCSELEAHVREAGVPFLVWDLFPEMASLQGVRKPLPPSSTDWEKAVSLLDQAIQLMEDVWVGCLLDKEWDHPLNQGWMNYFRRWSRTRLFRAFWPFVQGLYSPGFRRFAVEHLDAPYREDREVKEVDKGSKWRIGDLTVTKTALKEHKDLPEGAASACLAGRKGWKTLDLSNRFAFDFRLRMESSEDPYGTVQVGIAIVRIIDLKEPAEMRISDALPAPYLRGVETTAQCLHLLKGGLRMSGSARLRVLVSRDLLDPRSHRRKAVLEEVQYYRRHGFAEKGVKNAPDGDLVLDLDL